MRILYVFLGMKIVIFIFKKSFGIFGIIEDSYLF